VFGAEKGSADKLDGKKLSIGIVQSRFNESVTNALAEACKQELAALGVDWPSFFISSTSDLKMRIERPRLRATSGSFFHPKRIRTTRMRMRI